MPDVYFIYNTDDEDFRQYLMSKHHLCGFYFKNQVNIFDPSQNGKTVNLFGVDVSYMKRIPFREFLPLLYEGSMEVFL